LIITIMFVFDPLAVLLLIAVNMSLKARYGWSFEGKGMLDAPSSSKKKTEPMVSSVNQDSVMVKRSLIKYYHDLLEKTSKRLAETPKEKIVEKIVEKPVVKKVEIESTIDVTPPDDIKQLEQKILKQIKKGDKNGK